MMIITVDDLWKRYPGNWALRGIHLQVEKGATLGIFGENGGGKSTFLRILAGVTTPSKGNITINGLTTGIRTREIVAYLPEVNHLYARMTVKELFKFLGQFYPSWDSHKNRELCQFLGIKRDLKIGNLSKGQKLRLGIASIFSWPCDVVLMDEPFAAIDPVSRKKIIEGLNSEFRYENQTILIATHILSELEEVFDQVAYFNQGKILLSGNINQIKEEYSNNLTDVFSYLLENETEQG